MGTAIFALTLAAMAAAAPPSASTEVTVLTASQIRTVDAARPAAESMAFDAGGTILALGTRAEMLARYPQAKRLDAGSATVVPGLIDAHGHVADLGLAQLRANLVDSADKADVLQRLRTFAGGLQPGGWLLGHGWDQNDWPETAFPTAADLDAAFPDRPVWLSRIDGHAGWANSAAMRLVVRDLRGNWQPDGGQILRNAVGEPTGVFVDAAMGLIESRVPALDDAQTERALKLGMRAAVEHGLTGVHDAGLPLARMRAYQRLADRDELPLRIQAMADGNGEALAWLCKEGLYRHAGGRLQMRMVKLYADGALGSRGAALLEDYSDDPHNRGLLLTDPKDLQIAVDKARDCGVQVATHAIGDRGNRIVLDAYASSLGAASNERRWRIEHAQVIAPGDIPRLAKMGVIASMQPTHATSDMPWAEQRVGPKRIVGAYAWRQLRDSGARLALGSDFPVESVDPLLGLSAAVTRSDVSGKPAGGWRAEEKLTSFEALRGFTLDAAYAGFDEASVGSLAVGKRADFLLLDADPVVVDPSRLSKLAVLATYVDGKAVYEAKR